MSHKLSDALRKHAATLRTNSLPLSVLVPLLQQAADALDHQHGVADTLLREAERQERNNRVLTDALWKACADDEAIVNATIESQGGLK